MIIQSHLYRFTLVVILFLAPAVPKTQEMSQAELELKRQALLKEIQLMTDLLSKTRKEKEVSLNQFILLEKQIAQRENLISGIQRGLAATQNQILNLQNDIEYNEQQYLELTNHYATFLRASYRFRLRQNKWFFIFSTASISQIFQRWRYLNRLKNASLGQLSLIESLKDSLKQHKSFLEVKKEQQAALIRSHNNQKALLDIDLSNKQKTLNKLKEDEKGIASNLKKQMAEQERLNAEIRKIIEAKSGSSEVNKAEIPLTPASLRLSADFESNKGNLPWPVSRGVTVKSFGQQRHPTLKNVTTLNNGINIQVQPQTPVKAVFKGTVIDRRFIPGFNMVVMIRHGLFYTVYALLDDVVVTVGDLVGTGQILGTAASTDTGIAEIHFEIWRQKELVNPEIWLKTK